MKIQRGLLLSAVLSATAAVFAAGTPVPAASTPSSHAPRRVILVSIDGLKPEYYLHADKYGLKIPFLRRILSDGAWSRGMRGVFPTVTYPTHASMVTGVNPSVHGIVTNAAWDPLDRNMGGWRWYAEDIRRPTLWKLAARKGLQVGIVAWPVTVGAEAAARIPEIWRAGTPDDVKLMRALSTRGLLDKIAARFPDFYKGLTPPTNHSYALGDAAVYILETLKPRLLLLHLEDVDHEEHEAGPFTPPVFKAVEDADAQLRRLVDAAEKAGTWGETAMLVVSDHGFARTSWTVRPGVLLAKAGLVDFVSGSNGGAGLITALKNRSKISDWQAVILAAGGMGYIYIKEGAGIEVKNKVLSLLNPLVGAKDSGIKRIYTAPEIKSMGGDPKAFLALEAAQGYMISGGYRGRYRLPARLKGMHGYSPADPRMLASFLAYGPMIGKGEVKSPRVIDIAPTIAAWLGLGLKGADGAPLPIPVRR